MNQAVHILKKDVRYLWREICLLFGVATIFASGDPAWVEFVLPALVGYLISRLIHAEALPGDNQFWITRPYRWRSLLAAKLLFVVLFVNLPIAVARLIILNVEGFPFVYSLPRVMWSQFLMMAAVCLSMAALAAVTTDILPFIFSTFILLVIGLIVGSGMIPYLARYTGPGAGPFGVIWFPQAVVVALLIVAASVIVYMQYSGRRTRLSRLAGAAFLLLVLIAYIRIPPSLVMEVQRNLSPLAFDDSSVRFGTIPATAVSQVHRNRLAPPESIQLALPLRITGIPEGVDILPDGLSVSIQSTTGGIWRSLLIQPDRRTFRSTESGYSDFEEVVQVDKAFFNEHQSLPVTLCISMYLTAFGNAQSQNILLQGKPQNVMDGLQCWMDEIGQLRCRSAFRWPDGLVYAKVRDDFNVLSSIVSYSPFPAGLDLNYIEQHRTSGPPPSNPEATIVLKKRMSHFRRDVTLRDINLSGRE